MVDLLNITIGSLQQDYMFVYNQLSSIIGETYLQLFVFTIGLFIYAIFVWYFYKTLSKRDLFKINLEKYNLPYVKHRTLGKLGDVLAYILKYGFILPVYIFIWFLILSFFLLVLSEDITINHIILTSVVVVSATRVTSYYKEDLSNDMAKLIPFALLAILLINPNFFSMETTIARFSEIPNLWSQILQFLIFSIALEWILRILYLFKRTLSKSSTGSPADDESKTVKNI